MPCTVIPAPDCAGPSEPCYLDQRCKPGAAHLDPYGGLGCAAGGHELCRFCGFGPYDGIECPEKLISFELVVEGSVDEFRPEPFIASLAALVDTFLAHDFDAGEVGPRK